MTDYFADAEIPESRCCRCGHKANRAGDPAGEGAPRPGDFAICFRCGSLNVFRAGLGLRAPTGAELAEAAALDSDFRQMRSYLFAAKERMGPAR